MSTCKCDFRTHMLGDGCEGCTPAKALEYAKETIAEQEAEIEKLQQVLESERAANARLTEELVASREREARMRAVLETWMRAFEHAGPKLTIIDFDKLVRAALAEGAQG